MSTIDLNDDQQKCIISIVDWFKSENTKQTYLLIGQAGTGKTTIIKALIDVFKSLDYSIEDEIKVATLTWKSSFVLKSKKIFHAQSIHSLIYKATKTKKGWIYEKRTHEDFFNVDLIIIDEVSMVNKQIRNDIESFGIPILYVGDEFQLMPIEKTNEKDDFFEKYDYRLSKIVRQIENSPIIKIANKLRNFEDFKKGQYDNVIIKSKYDNDPSKYLDYNMILSGTNKTRKSINDYIRQLKGINPLNLPTKNEKLILFSNFNSQQLFNSDIIISINDHNDKNISHDHEYFEFYKEGESSDISYNKKKQNIKLIYNELSNAKQRLDDIKGKGVLWTFYNCLSVHKSQGSEWDDGLIIDESYCWRDEEEKFRWKYTAITRFKNNVTILI